MRPEPAPDPAGLATAYAATTYRIFHPQGVLALRPGALPAALLDGPGWRSLSVITADNPAPQRLDEAENARRRALLAAEVTAAGWRSWPALNQPDTPDWPPEPGLAIMDLDEQEAGALARRHGQVAWLRVESGVCRLVWTSPPAGQPDGEG